MKTNQKLAEELHRSVFKDPWHGSSLKEIFENIPYEKVYARPIPNAHNIIELALHIDAWTQEVLSRLNGNQPGDPHTGDWPKPTSDSNGYWDATKQSIYDNFNKLMEKLKETSDERLSTIVGAERNPALGTGYTFETMVIGLFQHNAYHGGQISLLKKFS